MAECRRRDVLQRRWTFQIVEGFDDDYYQAARSEVFALERRLVGGRRHAHEEALRHGGGSRTPALRPNSAGSSLTTADHCRHVDPVGTHDRVGCTGRRAGARRSPHRRGATPIFGVACRRGAKRRNHKRRRRQRYPVFSSALAARLMGVVETLDAVAKAAGIAPRGG